jgi:hypothetical protein
MKNYLYLIEFSIRLGFVRECCLINSDFPALKVRFMARVSILLYFRVNNCNFNLIS